MLLQPGVDQPWPAYPIMEAQPGILQVTWAHPNEYYEGREIRQAFYMIAPGAYTFGFHLGMAPLPAGSAPVYGWVELHTEFDTVILTLFYAADGAWTIENNSVTLLMPKANAWARLTYQLSGPANVSPDPRVTYLTITRTGQ